MHDMQPIVHEFECQEHLFDHPLDQGERETAAWKYGAESAQRSAAWLEQANVVEPPFAVHRTHKRGCSTMGVSRILLIGLGQLVEALCDFCLMSLM